MSSGEDRFIEKVVAATNAAINGINSSADAAGKSVDQLAGKVDNLTESYNKMGTAGEEAFDKVSRKQVKNDDFNSFTTSERKNYFTDSRGTSRKYLADQQTALSNLTQEWNRLNEQASAAGKSIDSVSLNNDKELKNVANTVYAWANSYKALGGDIDVVSDKLKVFMSEFSKTKNFKAYQTNFGEDTFKNMYSVFNELTSKGATIKEIFGKVYSGASEDMQKLWDTMAQLNRQSFLDKQSEEAARFAAETEKVNQEMQKMKDNRVASSIVGFDQESIDQLTKSLTTAVEKMGELKSGSGGGFSEEQFTKMAASFDSIESHLREMKAVISDVGEGKRFSPLMGELDSLVNKVDTLREKMNVLKDTMSNIKLNMDIGSAAVDNKANKNFEKNVQRRYAANKDLFEKIWKSGKLTPQTANYEKYLPEEKDDVEQLTAAYERLIKITEERYSKKALQKQFPDEYDEVRKANNTWNAANRKLAESTASFKEMFKPDLSGFESAVQELKKDILDVVSASTKISESLNVNGDGLALEKTLQAIKSISIEIVKYLSEINAKILSSADSEAILASKAGEAASAIAAQKASVAEVAAEQNKAITQSLKDKFGVKSGIADISAAVTEMQNGTGTLDDVLQVIINKLDMAQAKASGFFDEYNRVREQVSKSKISIDPTFKEEFGDDWNKVKSTIGNKVLVKSGGTDAETFLQELSADCNVAFGEINNVQDAIRALYEYLTKNSPKNANISGFAGMDVEHMREQAQEAIDEALGFAEAEEKIKLTAKETSEQQNKLNELLKSTDYDKFSSHVAENGKVIISVYDEQVDGLKRIVAEYKNLEVAEESIKNGTLLNTGGSTSGSFNREKYIKDLTAAYKEAFKAEAAYLDLQNKPHNEDQSILLNAQHVASQNKLKQLLSSETSSKYGDATKIAELKNQAYAIATRSSEFQKLFSLKNGGIDASSINELKSSYDSATESVNKLIEEQKGLADSQKKYTPDAVERVENSVSILNEKLKQCGVIIDDTGADFTNVQVKNAKSVADTISQIEKLSSSMKESDYVNSSSGKYIGKKMADVGTEEYYKELKALFNQQNLVKDGQIEWTQSGNKLTGVFTNQSNELQKVTLSAKATDDAVRMIITDMQERKKISESGTSNEEKFIKELTAAYKEQARALLEVNKAKLKGASAEDIAMLDSRVNGVRQKVSDIKATGSSYGFSNNQIEKFGSQAFNAAYNAVGYKNAQSQYNTIGVQQAQELATAYAQADAAVQKLISRTDAYKPSAIDNVKKSVSDLEKKFKELGVEITRTEDGLNVDMSNVLGGKTDQVKKLIEQMKNLKITGDSNLRVNTRGKYVGEATAAKGSDAYYAQLKAMAAAELQINEANVLWQKSGNGLVGTFRNQAKELQKVKIAADGTSSSIRMSVNNIQEMSAAQKWLSPLTSKMKELSVYFSSFTLMMAGFNAVKEGVSSIVELNQALTENQVVTGSSNEELEKFTANAQEAAKAVGSTTTELVESATSWARLGYNASDALQLAQQAAELAKVGFMDVDSATSSLTASLAGFYSGTQKPVERAQELVDKFVEIGNTLPISSEQIAEGLSNAGGVLAQGGNSVDEAIALLSAGNAQLQDISTVASSLRVVSMRLRSTSSSELQKEGEDTDGLIEDASKLRDVIKDLTSTPKNKGGIDILTDTGEYKSTYEIKRMSPYIEMYMLCA